MTKDELLEFAGKIDAQSDEVITYLGAKPTEDSYGVLRWTVTTELPAHMVKWVKQNVEELQKTLTELQQKL